MSRNCATMSVWTMQVYIDIYISCKNVLYINKFCIQLTHCSTHVSNILPPLLHPSIHPSTSKYFHYILSQVSLATVLCNLDMYPNAKVYNHCAIYILYIHSCAYYICMYVCICIQTLISFAVTSFR